MSRFVLRQAADDDDPEDALDHLGDDEDGEEGDEGHIEGLIAESGHRTGSDRRHFKVAASLRQQQQLAEEEEVRFATERYASLGGAYMREGSSRADAARGEYGEMAAELAERARAEARERLFSFLLAQAKRKHSEHMRAVLELEGVSGGAAAASAPAPVAPAGLAATAPAEPSRKYRIKKSKRAK
eukprot:CAMPEP_0185452912 /NCGR_PEP_ID=MMETSP1365-20130426/68516_1 /TAXON_ID=38817 /ORGANISM="Gephyrocapsa oceanica, Strain RCC1303" /LENGTH=184 /DNA_ID=CAMNT_0028059135 /DNA_START=138 /DNA_END=689 /DNA_ORIENTATION=+